MAELKNAILRSQPIFIIPVFIGIFVFYALKTLRFSILLSPAKHIPSIQIFPYMMAGISLNHFVLGQAGDIARMYIVGSRTGLKYSTVAAAIMLEWMIDCFAIVLLLLILIPFKSISYSLLYQHLPVALIVCGVAFLLIAGIVLFLMRNKGFKNYENALLGLKSLTKAHLLFKTIALSITMWVAMGFSHYFAIKAAGLAVPIEAPVMLIFLIVLSLFLPSAPARIGLIELSYVLGLAPFGIEAPWALIAAFFYHICLTISIMLMGLYAWKRLLMKNKEERDVK